MRSSPVWIFVLSAANLFCLGSVTDVLSQQNTSRFHCPENRDILHPPVEFKRLENCEAAIIMRKIHVNCMVYASATTQLPLFTNTTVGYLVVDYTETYQDLDAIFKQQSNSSCLKFTSSRIQSIDLEESEILKDQRQHRCMIPKEIIIPLMLTQLMRIELVLSRDYKNGLVHYNKTCLRQKSVNNSNDNDLNNSVDVSECITYTDVVRRFVNSGENAQVIGNLTMEDLVTKDFMKVILVLLKKTLFTGYDFSITYIAFKTSLLKYLPKKALNWLAQKNTSAAAFRGNDISSVRNDDIPQMDTLLTLDLSDCQIQFIEEKAFDGLVHLKSLNLRGNQLKDLPYAFRALHNIESLNLLGNGKRETNEFQYKSNIFGPESSLRNLDLSNMILTDFWAYLGKLPKLEQLNITNCSLSYLPVSNLSNILPNLTQLRLSRNSFYDIGIHSLSGFSKLRILDLTHTNLSHLRYNAIIDALPSLESISLSANAIPDFLPITLNNDSALRSLDLSYNKINSWNQSRINASTSILNLNLIGNNITEVNSYMIDDFNFLGQIQLASNPFDCNSCAMEDFLAWLELVNGSTDFKTTPYMCFFPKEDFKKLLTNVTLHLCREEVFHWITNALIPAVVIIVLVTFVTIVAIAHRWHIMYAIYLFRAKFHKYRGRDSSIVFKFDAFVSYCTADRNWVVEHLIPATEIQEPKLHLCVHERDFEVGETIMNNVIECIDNSHKSIFVISKRFIQSQWCQWELQMAQHKLFEDKRDVLILIILGDISEEKTPKMLKRLISKRTYLQWPLNENGQRLFWRRLRDAIVECY